MLTTAIDFEGINTTIKDNKTKDETANIKRAVNLYSIALKPFNVPKNKNQSPTSPIEQFVTSSLTQKQLVEDLLTKSSYRCVAWSIRNLVAFTPLCLSRLDKSSKSNIPILSSSTKRYFPIYVVEARRPDLPSCLVTDHVSPIKTLLWGPCGRSFLSSDESGLTCLWQMKENLLNEWECTYREQKSDKEISALKWINSKQTIEETGGATTFNIPYRSKYKIVPTISPSIPSGSTAWIAITHSADIRVVYRLPGQRKFSNTQVSLCYGTEVVQASISFYPDNEVLVCLSVSQNRVIVYSVKIDFSTDDCVITSRHLMALSLANNTERAISHISLSPSQQTLFACVSACDGSKTELKKWTKSSERYETNPGGVFDGSNTAMRHRVCWKNDLTDSAISSRVCHMVLSGSGRLLGIIYINGTVVIKETATFKNVAVLDPKLHANEGWNPSYPNQCGLVSLTFSPNESCVCCVDKNGNVYFFLIWPLTDANDMVSVQTPGSSPLHQFSLKLEISLLLGADNWDLISSLKHSSFLGFDFCSDVIETLEKSLAAQTPREQTRYATTYASLCAIIYRHSPDHVVDSIDYNCKLSLETVSYILRLCVAPVDRDISRRWLVDELSRENVDINDIVKKIRIEKEEIQSLLPVANWIVQAIVFFIKNLIYLCGHASATQNSSMSKPQLYKLLRELGIPTIRFLFEVSLIDLMRELCVYVLYIQEYCHPTEATRISLIDVKSLYHILSDLSWLLGKQQDIFADSKVPTLSIIRIKEKLNEKEKFLDSLKHPIFQQGRLLNQLAYLPKTPPPITLGARIFLDISKDTSFAESKPPPTSSSSSTSKRQPFKHNFDVDCLSHTYIPPETLTRRCVRCGRTTIFSPENHLNWASSWSCNCICGGLWALDK